MPAVRAAMQPAGRQRAEHPLLLTHEQPHPCLPFLRFASCSTYERGFSPRCQPGRATAKSDSPGARASETGRDISRARSRHHRVRPAGIEPAACGLKDRCSLAPRREPLTTELRARWRPTGPAALIQACPGARRWGCTRNGQDLASRRASRVSQRFIYWWALPIVGARKGTRRAGAINRLAAIYRAEDVDTGMTGEGVGHDARGHQGGRQALR